MLSTVFIKYIVKVDVNMNKMLSLALRKIILLIKKKKTIYKITLFTLKKTIA